MLSVSPLGDKILQGVFPTLILSMWWTLSRLRSCWKGAMCGFLDGGLCCRLSCPCKEFLKAGLIRPHCMGEKVRAHCFETWAETGNRRDHYINEWCGPVSAPVLVIMRPFPACCLQKCISLRVWLRKSWLRVVEWWERCQFFSLQNWDVWFGDRRGSATA